MHGYNSYIGGVWFSKLNEITYTRVDDVLSNSMALKKYCRNAFSQLANVSWNVVCVCVGGGGEGGWDGVGDGQVRSVSVEQ